MSLTLPKGLSIAFDPVTHATLFLEVAGDETSERRSLVGGARRRARSFRLDQAPARTGAHCVRKQIGSADPARRIGFTAPSWMLCPIAAGRF